MKAADEKAIWAQYTSAKTEADMCRPLWKDVERFVGIGVDTDYIYGNSSARQSQDLDEFVDDPTAALSVNQFGDYLIGIMWGTGDKVFNLIPSRYVTELVAASEVEDFYSFATSQSLYHMNHPDAGYLTALRPYAYDQASYGTSAIGIFPNPAFKQRLEENALLARAYGVDNMVIDEGKSGMIDIIFITYRWKINRIVGEFCMSGGIVDTKKLAKLPRELKIAYEKNDFQTEFTIVFGVMPREEYNPKFQGIKGTRYRGVWFLDNPQQNNIFFEEAFSERPISACRQILVRGEKWGRSGGTMMLSSIRSVNFMLGVTIEILEKMANPALGVTSNAIFGDSILDTSPNGLTVFNPMFANGQSPIFPLHDVGNPEGIIKFILPYLNEKITTAFKVDVLLDFNSAKEMTAREALQRYAIRGKSLTGILGQQKNERLVPDVRRAVSILLGMGELGIDPKKEPARAKKLRATRRKDLMARVIPEAVLQVIESGRPWYEIKFNNELEKLTRTEAVQNLLQVLNAITAIMAVNPQIANAVNWYKLLKDINDNLDPMNQIVISEDKFKKAIEAEAAQRAALMQLQAAQLGAGAMKDSSQANKNNQEAANAGR